VLIIPQNYLFKILTNSPQFRLRFRGDDLQVLSLAGTLVDSICELDYRLGRLSEVVFLIACTERSEILKASGIHPTMM